MRVCSFLAVLPQWWLLVSGLLAMPVLNPGEVRAQGADGGKFDGAVWRFTLKPKAPKLSELNGAYRVANDVLYQQEKRGDPDYTQVVGRNYPRRNKTRTVFSELRAVDSQRRVHKVEGTAALSFDKRGHWSGEFIDGEGRHWDITVVRVQE